MLIWVDSISDNEKRGVFLFEREQNIHSAVQMLTKRNLYFIIDIFIFHKGPVIKKMNN